MTRVLISWLNFITRSGLFLFIAPLLATNYNEQQLLLWYLCATFSTIIFTLDLGFSPTISRYISYSLTKYEITDKNTLPKISLDEVINASNVIYAGLSIFVLGVIGVAGNYYTTDILSASNNGESLWLLFLAASSVQAYSIRGGAILNGHDKVEIQQFISLAVSTYQISAAIIASILSLSFDTLFVLFYIAPFLLITLQSCAISKKIVLPKRSLKTSTYAYKEIFSSSWKSGIGMLASVGLFQASGLYYAAYFSPVAAASYMFTLQITRALGTISQVPLYAYLPQLARNFASGQIQQLNHSFEKKLLASLTLYIAASIVILFLGSYIFLLLGATKIYPSHTLLFLMLVGMYVERFGAALMQFYTVTNHIIWHWVNGSTCALIIAFTILLKPSQLELAFPMAFILGNLLIFSWVPLYKSKKYFSITHYKFEILLAVGITVITAAWYFSS